MTVRYLRGYAVRDAAGSADPGTPIPFTLATEGRKADGLDLRMSTVDLGRYEANPVLGYGHAYWGRDGLPIGRVEAPRVDGDRLLGDLVFDQDDEFATTVERKIRGGFLRAVSIGFEAFDIDQAGVPRRWELFETSVVPLPMDPDAVAEGDRALARALGGLRAGKVLSSKNKSLVQSAIDALGALLEAAAEEAPDDGRGLDPDTADALRRARLRL